MQSTLELYHTLTEKRDRVDEIRSYCNQQCEQCAKLGHCELYFELLSLESECNSLEEQITATEHDPYRGDAYEVEH